MPYAERMFFLLGLGILLISIGWFVLVYLPEYDAAAPPAVVAPSALPDAAPPVVEPAVAEGAATEGASPEGEPAPVEAPAPETPATPDVSPTPAAIEEPTVPVVEPELAPGTTVEKLPESMIPKVEDQRNAPVQMLQLRDAPAVPEGEGDEEGVILD
jgi:hypothetical protein